MLTTNSAEIWERAWSFKDHGKSWDAVYKRRHREGFRWLHESFGSNWRMTEMQAAIGRCQIGKMPDWHEKRVQNAQALYGVGVDHSTVVEVPQIPDAIEHAWYKFYLMVRVAGLADGWDRDRILTRLGELGVPSYSGSCPEVYLEKAFEGGSYRFERLPVARDLGERSLMFLVHPTLTDKDMEQMLIRIDQVLKEASK
jgi:dTDP-4-amino-4,6-dideoxygalactose transaminase